MTTPLEEIEAYVEGYRGSRDAPGYEACLRAEINERLWIARRMAALLMTFREHSQIAAGALAEWNMKEKAQ
jgi:hypothetical protein